MFVPFENMPKHSRVWVYQANRKLTESEESWLNKVSQMFCEQWAAHGSDLKSSFKLYHRQFLVLAVDEAASLPSGCSIDSSVHLVREAEAKLGLDFFDRTQVGFLRDDEVQLTPMSSLKGKIQDGEILAETLTFNNLVATIDDLDNRWTIPARESWLKKYFT